MDKVGIGGYNPGIFLNLGYGSRTTPDLLSEAKKAYSALFQVAKAELNDILFVEYGSIDLKDIFPEEPLGDGK